MILSVLITYVRPSWFNGNKVLIALNRLIKRVFSKVINSKSNFGLFFAGMANGILPCGFVYLAMAGAATTQDFMNGALYMFLFGLGTFPAKRWWMSLGIVTGKQIGRAHV